MRRTDAPLTLARTGARDGFAVGDGAATVEGDALDVLYLVSRRRPLDASSVRGDRAEVERLVVHTDWVGG